MFSGPAISIFYLIVKLGIFVKLKKEKIPVYGILVLSLNPISVVIQNQSYIFVDSLTSFSILVLIYLYSFPYIKKINKLLFSIPLVVAILHTERNLLLQLIICEVTLVWISHFIFELMKQQHKKDGVINLTFVNILITHFVEILLLYAIVEKIAGYQQITISLLIISAIFLLVFSLYPQLIITKSTLQWNWTLSKEDGLEESENFEEEEYSPKNDTKLLIEGIELTEREKEVIDFIAKGHTSKEIAEKMFLSKKTIDLYRSRIKEKLGYSKKSELVEFVLSRTDSVSPNIKHTAKITKTLQEEHISI